MNGGDTQVNVNMPESGPNRTEFEVLKRDVNWLKYGVAVSAATGVFGSALQLGAAPMPAGVAGAATAVLGLIR